MPHHKLLGILLVLAMALALGLAPSAQAQPPQSEQERVTTPMPPGWDWGLYHFNTSLVAGYRTVDVTDPRHVSDYWANERYLEAYNLRKGAQLTAFDVYAETKQDHQGFFDQLFLTSYGIGEPFTSATLRMRSYGNWDFKAQYRRDAYYLDRDIPDKLYNNGRTFGTNATPPAFPPEDLFLGLHKFDQTRNIVNASLNINANDWLGFDLRYFFTNRSGDFRMTNTPFIDMGVDALVGTYARGNYFWIVAPRDDQTHEGSLAANFKLNYMTTLSLGGGYRDLHNEIKPNLFNDTSLTFLPAPGVPNAFSGIVGNDPFNERLTSFFHDETRHTKTPFGFFDFVTRPFNGFSLTGNVRYEHEDMTSAITHSQAGVIRVTRGTSNFLDNYRSSLVGDINGIRENLFINASATQIFNKMFSATALYRYYWMNERNRGTYTGTFDTAGPGSSVFTRTDPTDSLLLDFPRNEYHIPLSVVQGAITFLPIEQLGVTGGLQYVWRDPRIQIIDSTAEGDEPDSAVMANLNKKTTSLEPFVDAWYRPNDLLRFWARYEHSSLDASVAGVETDVQIRIDPRRFDRYRVGIDVTPDWPLTISASYRADRGVTHYMEMLPTVINPVYTNNRDMVAASIGYTFPLETELLITGEYRVHDYEVPFTFTRGTKIPVGLRPYGDSMTVRITQHTIDRFIDATLSSKVIKNLRIQVGGYYLRSTGGNDVTPFVVGTAVPDVTRFGGPYREWNWHALLGYNFTVNIGLEAEYQQVYLAEDVVDNYYALNNFRGNLFRGSLVLQF